MRHTSEAPLDENAEIHLSAAPSFISADAVSADAPTSTSEVLDLTIEQISEPVGDELDSYLCLSCGTPAGCSGQILQSDTFCSSWTGASGTLHTCCEGTSSSEGI
jgi:hypothetical protein